MSSVASASGELVLRDVRGPTAFIGDWHRFRTLLWVTARTEFKSQYANLWLGSLWTLLRPLGLAAVLYLLFTSVLRFGGDIEHYPAMLIFNIMMFFFFAETTTRATKSMLRSERVVSKTEFPRAVVPMAVVLKQSVMLGMSMVVAAGFLVALQVPMRTTWLFIPVILLALIVLTLGVSMLLAALYPRFRDIEQIWLVARRPLFYASAIVFPIEFVPENFQAVLLISPLAPLMVMSRRWVFDPDAPTLSDVAGTWGVIGPAAVFVGVCVLGFTLFVRRAGRITEEF